MTKKDNSNNAFLKLSTAAFQMAAIIGGFTWLGTFLDKQFQTATVFTIVLALLGVVIGLYMIIKEVNSLNREN
jgi:F0F1-type ATP synthase assembly protein I